MNAQTIIGQMIISTMQVFYPKHNYIQGEKQINKLTGIHDDGVQNSSLVQKCKALMIELDILESKERSLAVQFIQSNENIS